MEDKIYHFNIAEFLVRIVFKGDSCNDADLLPSFKPFLTNDTGTPPLFQLYIDDDLQPVDKKKRERIREFDTGNGKTIVDRIDDGGYQYIIKDIKGYECCLLQTNSLFSECKCALNGNKSMRNFGLNNALMLAFAFSSSEKETLLIHASVVRQENCGYAFIAKSGTGKSTHTSLWLSHLEGCDLMNDDNPIIRVIDDKAYIYGSPWSGKTPCYRNVKAELGAITRIDRAKKNSIEKLSPVEAFSSLLPSCSSMKWDERIFGKICDTITHVVETANLYILHCLPDKEAAILCNQTIKRKEN